MLSQLNYLFSRKNKIRFILILFVIILGSLVELLGVSSMLPIIDMAININQLEENLGYRMVNQVTGITDARTALIVMIVAVIAVYVVKNIYLSWMNYVVCNFSISMKREMAVRLMESYMKQSYPYFLSKKTSEIIRSINSDTEQLYELVINCLYVISSGLTVLLLITYLTITNWRLTLLMAVVFIVFALLIMRPLQKTTGKLGEKNRSLSVDLIQYVKQDFEGIKEIKLMNREQSFIDKYKEVYDKHTKVTKKFRLINVIPKFAIETVAIGTILLYLAYNVYFKEDYIALVSQLAVFAVAAFRLLPCVNAVFAYTNTIMFNKIAIELVYDDIHAVDKVESLTADKGRVYFRDKLQVRDISFSYSEKDRYVLEHINLEIRKGESIAFIGASGGGKTTLVDIIIGLLEPNEGSVVVDGVKIKENIRGWQKNIGYIPQTIYLLDDTIVSNIAFGIKKEEIDENRVWKALEDAQLKEFVQGLPDTIYTIVGERGARLSGGQRQRIGIARALYGNPEVLIFDEATSALDNTTESEVMKAIEGLKGSKTMIMIAHRLSTIESCDTVYRIEDKKIMKER